MTSEDRKSSIVSAAFAALLAIASVALLSVGYAQQPGSGANPPTGGVEIQRGTHQIVTGAPPVLSSCGTGPSIVGTDLAARLVTGAAATTCLLTFAVPWVLTPICSVDGESTLVSYIATPATINMSVTASTVIHVQCIGQPGG